MDASGRGQIVWESSKRQGRRLFFFLSLSILGQSRWLVSSRPGQTGWVLGAGGMARGCRNWGSGQSQEHSSDKVSTSWGIEPHTGQEAGRKIHAHTLPVCHALPKEVYRVIAVPIHPLALLPIYLSVHPPNHSPTHRPSACPSVDP